MKTLLLKIKKLFKTLTRMISLILTTIYVVSIMVTGTALVIFKTWDYSPLLTIVLIASVFYVVFKMYENK